VTDDVTRKRIARAIYDDGAYCGDCDYEGWDTCEECRDTVYRYADSVMAILAALEAAS
jgi:hypothetical protein